jgi:hypothetical protein
MTIILDIYKEHSCVNTSGETLTFENGIDFAKYKRRSQHCKDPILFRSALPLSHFIDKPGNSILGAIGHGFIQIPYSDAQLKAIIDSINPLNDIQLQDIIINFCQLRSAIRDSFHIFKGKLRKIIGQEISNYEKNSLLHHEFSKYRTELLKEAGEYPELLTEFDRIISLYDPQNISSVEKIQATQEENLVCYLPDDKDEQKSKTNASNSWKILFLDDDPAELNDIFTTLKQRNIEYDIAKTFDSAKEIILNDHSNRITVIVCDYRLYEEGSGSLPAKMQSKQGYDFILWISKQYRHNALVALSGLSKWFLLESFRKYSIGVKVYSKNGLLGGGTSLFADDLEYLGSQYNDIVNNQPTATFWHNPNIKKGVVVSHELIKYYVYHRNYKDYLNVEDRINRDAEKVAREAEFALDKSSNFNLGAALSIYGGMTTNMKGNPEKEYEIFCKKLLQRRIFFYLQIKGFNKEAIVMLLQKGDMRAKVNDIGQPLLYLAIESESDLPHHLLAEEKHFLQNIMHIPIYQISELTNQAHVIINKVVNRQIQAYPEIADKINNYLVFDENSKTLYAQSVSLFDAHVMIKNIVNNFPSQEAALSLIAQLIDIFKDIHSIMPRLDSIGHTIEKLTELKRKIR